MNPLQFDLAVLSISVLAGILGSLLGLGGGIIIIPALTLLFIDIVTPSALRSFRSSRLPAAQLRLM